MLYDEHLVVMILISA